MIPALKLFVVQLINFQLIFHHLAYLDKAARARVAEECCFESEILSQNAKCFANHTSVLIHKQACPTASIQSIAIGKLLDGHFKAF